MPIWTPALTSDGECNQCHAGLSALQFQRTGRQSTRKLSVLLPIKHPHTLHVNIAKPRARVVAGASCLGVPA